MSYLEFYSMKAYPFSCSQDERFFYESRQQKDAFARLAYLAESMQGLGVVVGEIGTGKTTLALRLLDSLPRDRFEAALLIVANRNVSESWFFHRLAAQIGAPAVENGPVPIIDHVCRRLVSIRNEGRSTVILLDEANMLLSPDLMAAIRGLLNVELDGEKLITFILIGLPELDLSLRTDPALRQRVALHFRMRPMDGPETAEYIAHRLKTAGCPTSPFSAEVVSAVHRISAGVPRLVNTICDNLLLEGFLQHKSSIASGDVLNVAESLGIDSSDDQAAADRPGSGAHERVSLV